MPNLLYSNLGSFMLKMNAMSFNLFMMFAFVRSDAKKPAVDVAGKLPATL